jgi:hypothetical protein
MPHGIGELLAAIRETDQERVEATILRMSRSRRMFAPLAFGVGAFALLFEGLRLLVTNWRLTLVQILPAMWIWLATYDLKVHVLHGRSFNVVRGPVLIPIFLVIIAVTVGSFFLNGVFAFAINRPGKPEIGPGIATAKRHIRAIALSGAILGVALAFSTTVVTRWGRPWFALCLGVVVGAMMISYVAVPARLLGVRSNQSRRDKLWATGLGAALGATVCTPPYVLARIGILMLGSKALIIPGVFVLTLGVALQAGATGAVSAIKMSTKLRAGAQTS